MIYFMYICIVIQSKTKNRIIETASFLFYKNGYNSTGINEIISEAGIAKATLYSHFKSKEDICLAYLNFKNTTFTENIEKFATSKTKGKAQVLAIFDFLEKFYHGDGFNGCWCIKTVSEIPHDNEKIRNEIQAQKRGLIQFISKLIINNLDDVDIKNVPQLSRKIYLLYESAVSESYLHQEDWPIFEAKSLCLQLIS